MLGLVLIRQCFLFNLNGVWRIRISGLFTFRVLFILSVIRVIRVWRLVAARYEYFYYLKETPTREEITSASANSEIYFCVCRMRLHADETVYDSDGVYHIGVERLESATRLRNFQAHMYVNQFLGGTCTTRGQPFRMDRCQRVV